MSAPARASKHHSPSHLREALRLACRGYGDTSPNPMVGAVLVKGSQVIGRGWHRFAGAPHAEVEAIRDAEKRGTDPRGATLYVTLEPCSTHGRTPPCTDAIIASGIKRVVIGTVDPNPRHAGKAFKILQRAGIEVHLSPDRIADECVRLNEAFNHWIVHRTPFVTVKAAMTLDGKIATADGESKWITSELARAYAMDLRRGADAILVGVNTVLADDPSLTFRGNVQRSTFNVQRSGLRRIVLDSTARTPLNAKVISDKYARLTTIVVSEQAAKSRIKQLSDRVNVLIAPLAKSTIDNSQSTIANSPSQIDNRKSSIANRQSPIIELRWLLKKLGRENVTHLLVEGGGEVNASFLLGGLAQRVAFFYAPKILGGRDARKAVAGEGAKRLSEVIQLHAVEWKKLGPDLLLTARCD
jgi:diaminohydroxyphosphoribosylaminopyrimidine deaminase/5-amino-6-(5-phosphoribosylamino)uracil reductase